MMLFQSIHGSRVTPRKQQSPRSLSQNSPSPSVPLHSGQILQLCLPGCCQVLVVTRCFVRTRVAEIQELTASVTWHYDPRTILRTASQDKTLVGSWGFSLGRNHVPGGKNGNTFHGHFHDQRGTGLLPDGPLSPDLGNRTN